MMNWCEGNNYVHYIFEVGFVAVWIFLGYVFSWLSTPLLQWKTFTGRYIGSNIQLNRCFHGFAPLHCSETTFTGSGGKPASIAPTENCCPILLQNGLFCLICTIGVPQCGFRTESNVDSMHHKWISCDDCHLLHVCYCICIHLRCCKSTKSADQLFQLPRNCSGIFW